MDPNWVEANRYHLGYDLLVGRRRLGVNLELRSINVGAQGVEKGPHVTWLWVFNIQIAP